MMIEFLINSIFLNIRKFQQYLERNKAEKANDCRDEW